VASLIDLCRIPAHEGEPKQAKPLLVDLARDTDERHPALIRSSSKENQMNSMSLLQGKHAVVFGAGGSLGAAVAREFAAEGAEVFLSGRTRSNVEDVAKHITTEAGDAHAAVIDALDNTAVNDYMDDVARQAGKIDIVYNATGPRAREYGNGKPAVELTVEEFMRPTVTVLKSNFITARAAARHMVQQHSGVILFVAGSPSRGHVPGATAIGSAFGALENLTENLAIEVVPSASELSVFAGWQTSTVDRFRIRWARWLASSTSRWIKRSRRLRSRTSSRFRPRSPTQPERPRCSRRTAPACGPEPWSMQPLERH